MAIKYDMMANAIVVVSFVVALSAVCFYVLNAPSSTGTQHQSRCRRSRSQRAQHHAMAGFGCKEMRRYSPSNILLPDVNYLPTAYYTPIDQCFPVVSHMYFHPSGPHAIRVYIPPPTPTTKRSYFPSPVPIPVTYFPSFMIPHYHDPYGPTAVQIYSAYTPPLVELRSIRDVIGLGQDDNVLMPICHHNEATPFLSQPMLLTLPTQSVDFRAVPPHCLVFPVLGLCLVVALGLFALFCALKKLRHREPVAEFEENHLASSSFELIFRKHKFLKKNEVCDNIPNKHESMRNERLKGQRKSRSNNGFPINTKFPPKSKFVTKKRRLSDVSMHLYQLDLLWNSRNEQSIPGTFALYCTLYCAIKRRRYHKPDVNNFEFEEKFSEPSSTDDLTSECEENISAPYSDDPHLLNHKKINESFSDGNQMWAQCSLSDVVSTDFKLNDNIPEPSFYVEEDHHCCNDELPMCRWMPNQLFFPRLELGYLPVGLENLKNTCYLNSVLQCLSFTPPLAQFCLGQSHSTVCPFGAGRGYCPVCLLEDHVYLSHTFIDHPKRPLEPQEIIDYFCDPRFVFERGRQEDAHELLVCLIGACIRFLDQYQLEMTATVFKQMFNGRLLRQVECRSCGTKSDTYEPFLDIGVDIIHSSSLHKSLHDCFAPERLADRYNCSKCSTASIAMRRCYIYEAPNILLIHVKRTDAYGLQKINKHLNFEEYLDFSSYMSQTNRHCPKSVYQLYGMVVHDGYSLNSGHYFAYIKNIDGYWYWCNDSIVQKCDIETILSKQAYILFYGRTTHSPSRRIKF